MRLRNYCVLWILIVPLALCGFGYGSIFLAKAQVRERAGSLLRDVRRLRAGFSKSADVEAIAQRYAAEPKGAASDCPSADRTYSISIASNAMTKLSVRFPGLERTVLRPVGASALILLERGAVCYVDYGVGTVTAVDDQDLEASTTVTHDASGLLEGSQYRVRMSVLRGRIHRLDVRIGSAPTEEQREHAFDYDLSCLTRLQGCQAVCELMPSAWLDYQKERRAEGWTLPAEDANDPYCKKLGDAE